MAGNAPDPLSPRNAERFNSLLRQIASASSREARREAIDLLAKAVAQARATSAFLGRLVKGDRHGQRLALELAARLSLDDSLTTLLLPLLADARFSERLRLRVGVHLLEAVGPSAPETLQIVQTLVQGFNPHRALERTRSLQEQLPQFPIIHQFRQRLEEASTFPCPKCGTRLSRPDLVVHLWQEHRLMLDGLRAREPWKMIEQWLAEYAETGRKELLDRSCELGEQLDPQGGLLRVHRLLLSAGLTDEEAQENLRGHAAGRRATLCPHCYAFVSERLEWVPPLLNLSRGRVTGQGYRVELSDQSIFSRLIVESPRETIYRGTEPGRPLTRRGLVLTLVGPLVVTALILAIFLPTQRMPPLTPVSVLLLLGIILHAWIRWNRKVRASSTDRAIDYSWEYLVPALHQPSFSERDGIFLSSLARTSMGYGSPETREEILDRISRTTQTAVSEGRTRSEYLAAVRCLQIDDAMRVGGDPLRLLSDQLGLCLSSDLPLEYGEELLEAWPSEARDRGERARLRILICTRAFELGFEPRDLQEVGRISPSLGQIVASEDLHGLCRLRWLWLIKPSRSWQAYGSASTAFDLARYPTLGAEFLEQRPDLLLFQPMSDDLDETGSSSPILICEEGIVYRKVVINDPDTRIIARPRALIYGGGYELLIGTESLSFPRLPERVAKRLQGWVKFLFRDFLPRASEVRSRRSPEKVRRLMRQKRVRCPECEKTFLALRGEVGIPLETQPRS